MSTFYGDNYTFQEGADTYEVTATYGNRGSETVKLNDGSTIDIFRGTAEEDEQTKKLQKDQYVLKQTLAFQAEQDAMSEALKQQYPDGRGYTAAMQEYSINRRNELVDSAPADAKEAMSGALRNQVIGSITAAQKYEAKMAKYSLMDTYYQSQGEILSAAADNPHNLEALRIEAMDRAVQLGQSLGWTPSEIKTQSIAAAKAVQKSALNSLAMKTPQTLKKLLNNGFYDNILNESEKKYYEKRIKSSNAIKQNVEALPTLVEAFAQANKTMDSGTNLDDAEGAGQINKVQKHIVDVAIIAENSRLKDPNYKNAKDSLTSINIPLSTDDDKAAINERLRNLYDTGKLNEQSVGLLQQELKQQIYNRVQREANGSNYLQDKDLSKANAQTLQSAIDKVGSDYRSRRITKDQAAREFQILINAQKVLGNGR